MAGESLIQKRKRDLAVSPTKQNAEDIIALVSDGLGDLDKNSEDEHEQMADADGEWEKLADKYEDLEKKVEEYLTNEQDREMRRPPIVAAPPTMTKEEWERHQATHTLYGRLQALCGGKGCETTSPQEKEAHDSHTRGGRKA